jgi:hypothetical protein
MTEMARRIALLLLLIATSVVHGQRTARTYAPVFDARSMSATIDHPYLPLIPGAEYRFQGTGASRGETTIVTVTNETRSILGVPARVVHDRVFRGDTLVEDTYDWYAQDAAGNVWYLGEDTKEYKNGKLASTEGSWEAGVRGARPGIAMPANPAKHIGERYQQEQLDGVAEDRGRVVATHASITVKAGTYQDCIETEDTTPLEPVVRERKFYCRGVGLVRERESEATASELVAVKRGTGSERQPRRLRER